MRLYKIVLKYFKIFYNFQKCCMVMVTMKNMASVSGAIHSSVGLLFGFAIMLIIALYEDKIVFDLQF